MSESSRLRAYRACINLPGWSNGQVHLIDEDDDGWANWIAQGRIVPVGPPVDYEPPAEPVTRDNPPDDEPWQEIVDAELLAARGLDQPAGFAE